MLRHLLILPLCLWLTMASGLNLDSLWGVWNDTTQPDTNRLKAIDKIAWDGYLFSKPDSAFYFAQMQYELAEATGNKQSMADALNTQGATFYIQGNYDNALLYYDKSLKIKEEIGNKNGMADSYGNMGSIYADQGNHEQALEYNQKSLKIFEETGNKRGMASSYNNIGIIYKNQGNYEQALEYYEKSFKIKEVLGNKRGMATSYNNIGEIYGEQGNYEKALKYYNNSLKIEEEVGNKTGIVGSYNNMGSLAFEQGNYPDALDLGKKALAMAQEVGVVTEIKEASNLLYDIYKKTGQPAKALEVYELYTAMRDSLNSMNNKEAAIKLEYQHKYETQSAIDSVAHAKAQTLREEQIKRQRAELESEKTYRVVLFAGIGLISIFLILAINRFLVTRRQKETIEGQKKVVEEQKGLVEEQKRDITDSIRYAENIQQALLPTIDNLNEALPDGFVLLQPKDIISGDFYWLQQHNNQVYFAVCDCTGHGVPGAFMSMIGSSLLDDAVVEKGITKPNEIFFEVREGFINALKQTEETETQKDGMDAVLCSWNKHGNLEYALAYNPLLLIRKGELIETKADKQPVGFHTVEQKPFTHHELKLEKGDTVYIFSDGYPDQFGGPRNKKFMLKNFKKLLLSIQDKTMNEQKTILEDTMAEWKGDTEQIDDILVMGVRF